jgi:class 3 adenylate cyclase
MLLESIYGQFDKIALKRGVFKVETIGDCYVAVTGIPRPQDDHAVRMVKFAQDCQNKMTDVLVELDEKLGGTTLDLCMRVGLHSGPVTGTY